MAENDDFLDLLVFDRQTAIALHGEKDTRILAFSAKDISGNVWYNEFTNPDRGVA